MSEKQWIKYVPITLSTSLLIISAYFLLRFWIKGISIIISQIKKEDVMYGMGLFGKSYHLLLITVVGASVIAIFSWLLSTRVKFYQSNVMRLLTFGMMVLTIWGGLAAYGMNQIKKSLIPFFEERLENVIETSGFFESIVFDHTDNFYLMLLLIPLYILFFISLFLLNKYIQFEDDLKEAFFDFKWSGNLLQKFSKLEQQSDVWPDIELGRDIKTGEMVVLPGRDRTLNTTIIGSIGTGKSAALGLPMINQDLHHMTRYINDFPKIYKREDFLSEDVSGRYLSGISIIDPSNDLCQKVYQLAKAHNIPDEAITYINPLDPNTPNINPMRGPVDKVAEVFAQVIAGLNDSKDGGSFYFEQAQRNHLKHYIYLLKLHDPEKEVTFDMLIDMYNNPQLVRKMHEALKRRIPADLDAFEDRDERNYWKIVQGIDEWFDLNLLPVEERVGNVTVPKRNEKGEIMYYDAKAEHVQGLRNILNDIGANPLIRRVLFGKSNFDFDVLMAKGGILLVNTAKGELVNLARVLGKIVLMNLQNATFRRPPNVSSFHHILVDEAPDYLYNAFREFPAQSRKYKVIITTLKQTIAQLADHFGEHYMTTLIGTMRNRMVYGDVPPYDAKYFSEMFGEKYVYQEGQTEMAVSPLQEHPMSRAGSSFQKVREQKMTSGDIMFQDAFNCSVKIVVNNKPMPVVQIKANFVPKQEFEDAVVKVKDECAKIWIEDMRNTTIKREIIGIDADIQSVEETEVQNEENYEFERKHAFPINIEHLEKVAQGIEPRPRDDLQFTYVPPAVPVRPLEKEELVSDNLDNHGSDLNDLEDKDGATEEDGKQNDFAVSELTTEQQKKIDSLFKEF